MRWVENEISMKLVAWGMKTWPLGMKYHAQGTKCLCLVWNESTAWNKNSFHKVWNCCIRVWKKFSRYEKNWKVWKKIQRYEKKFQGMKLFLRVWKKTFLVWKKTNFCKFPISYPRVWKKSLFFPDESKNSSNAIYPMGTFHQKEKQDICDNAITMTLMVQWWFFSPL